MSGTHDILAAERAAAAEGKNNNQGIWNGRPVGEQPRGANLTTDTVVDKNAADTTGETAWNAEDTLGGATSADVYAGAGHPGSGMSSQEMHHDGRRGRK